MFKFNSAHTVSNKAKTRKFVASVLMVASIGTTSLQTGFVLNANASNNPISSPVTTQETPTPTPSPLACPIGKVATLINNQMICVIQNQTQNNNQTQNSAQVQTGSSSGSSSSVSTTAPITSPEVVIPSSQPSPNNGSSNGGSVSAPSCDNEAPKSAPKIISAVTTGANEITLTWEKAEDPVTHYVISYGLVKGTPLFGNPNVGNVTSYTVKGLSGNIIYYFQVRAGNDCQPGKYSEETAVKVGGRVINKPAQNFVPGVLGQTISSPTPSATPSVVPSSAPQVNENTSNGGLIGQIINFFKGLFN